MDNRRVDVAATGRAGLWTGRVMTALVGLMFSFSAVMKFVGGEPVVQAMTHLGLSESMIVPLGILELACVVAYLVPATSVIGAILLTGYTGGVILTHWRVGDPFIVPIVLGLAIWGGLWLRDARLKDLMPLRKSPAP